MWILRRFLARTFLLLLTLAVVGAAVFWVLINRSLPALDGDIQLTGIAAEVTIARDEAGIATITAGSRTDLAFATGFVHAQDRYFQMDLTRRKAAGELAELFGEVALNMDRRNRLHRFRRRANAALEQVTATEAAVLTAYTEGVNAGLQELGARPFEYLLLAEAPRPWTEVDSILVGYAMFLELNDDRAIRDVRRGLVHRVLPQAVFDWLYPRGTKWDAPMLGEAWPPVALPDAATFTIANAVVGNAPPPVNGAELIPGSNNWAIAGNLTSSGRALVANDMHLAISVPNIFYRARLRVKGEDALDLNGLTLPGVPVIVSGSNGHIAWGNTNSYGDWTDAVIVRAGQAPGHYLTPDGERPFVTYNEQIKVKGRDPVEFVVRETIWGPVLDESPDPEHTLAVSWIAHHPEAINIGQLALETTTTAADALRHANSFGMPPQNFVVGDAAGNIGWTIAGKIPRRAGFDPFLPADWSETGGWLGWLEPTEYPRILNPVSGRIWTANARVVNGEALQLIGDSGYDLGARAAQIRDSLFSQDAFATRDMLRMQLDDRALFLSRWRALILLTLNDDAVAGNAQRATYLELVADWIPRATADSTGYRLVRGFRLAVRDRVFNMLMQPVRAYYGDDIPLRISNQFEAPLWTVLTERPPHLLSADYSSWDDLLLQAIDAEIEYLSENFSGGLAERTWGERNTAAVRHPLSRALPFLSKWLDMPKEALDGDANLPRAQGPSFGASERFGVSPGEEASGYLHMPSGQSGHPLSDFYRQGHDDWVQGRFSPYLPGDARYMLTLNPAN
jgi:penicillin amidase